MENFVFQRDIQLFFSNLIKDYQKDKIFVLCDDNTEKFCFPKIKNWFEYEPFVIVVAAGEKNKNIQTATNIWQFLNTHNADRHSLLINLGGGMVTDLGGFVASTYKRGIDFINIPTTLLAQVDASIGGKTGIDLDDFKNIVGTFSTPKAVLASVDFLDTLPQRQIISGFAEMIKHSLLDSEAHWKKLKSVDLDNVDFDYLQLLIKESANVKLKIVETDPFEKLGSREALNFGHTVGHAVETYLNKKGVEIYHGEAVAIGMIAELFISNKILGLDFEVLFEISEYLATYFTSFDIGYDDYDTLLEIMKHDKKNADNKIKFTLLQKIGEYKLQQTCTDEEIIQALNFYYQVRK